MFKRFPRLPAAAFLAFFLLFPPLSAISFGDNFHWSINGSLFYFVGNEGIQDADPAPILPSLGGSAAWQFGRFIRLELIGDIYFTNYEYNGYPMPSNPENRSAFVLGFKTGVYFTGVIPIGDNGTIVRVYGGPAADLRLVLLAIGLNHPNDFTGDLATDAQMQTDAIREYFWSDGRMLFASLGAGMDFPLNEKFLLGFDLRVWVPIYRIWTGEDIPFMNDWRFGVGFRITPR